MRLHPLQCPDWTLTIDQSNGAATYAASIGMTNVNLGQDEAWADDARPGECEMEGNEKQEWLRMLNDLGTVLVLGFH